MSLLPQPPYFMSLDHARHIFGPLPKPHIPDPDDPDRLPPAPKHPYHRIPLWVRLDLDGQMYCRTRDLHNLHLDRTSRRRSKLHSPGALPVKPWPFDHVTSETQSFEDFDWTPDDRCFGIFDRWPGLMCMFPREPDLPGQVLTLHYQVLVTWLYDAKRPDEKYRHQYTTTSGKRRWAMRTLDHALYLPNWSPRVEPLRPSPPRVRPPSPMRGRPWSPARRAAEKYRSRW